MRATRAEIATHRLINKERVRRGCRWVKWDSYLYKLAKRQANRMAKAGRLFHSDLDADASIQEGGECCAGGMGNYSPRDHVNAWLNSPRHRQLILGLRAKEAAVGIASSRKGTYASWVYSA
jgi:uncharacterized protein YkwD